MTVHLENFVAMRKTYPRRPLRHASRLDVASPRTSAELDYRDLLSDANTNFFQREFTIALEGYLALRDKILVQSHPEMPSLPHSGGALGIDISKVDINRIIELSRRHLLKTNPGDPVELGLANERVIQPGEFAVNPIFQKFAKVGLDAQLVSKADLGTQRQAARDRVLEGDLKAAAGIYQDASDKAVALGDGRLAAELMSELGAMQATYASGADRAAALANATKSFTAANQLFAQVGDAKAQEAMQANITNVRAELAAPPAQAGVDGAVLIRFPVLKATRTFQASERGTVAPIAALLAPSSRPDPDGRQVGLLMASGPQVVSLSKANFANALVGTIYKQRMAATTLEAMDFLEELDANFVAYIPHLFFFVLPMAIGDTYLAMGRYQSAIDEYRTVLAYPFLNQGIELAYVWQAIAKVYLAWGDTLFRQEQAVAAKAKYESVIKTDLTVPLTSVLYQAAALAPMRTAAGEVVKEMRGQPHAATNPKVAVMIMQANVQLQKIAHSLNFLGIGPDEFPIFRFKYLEQVANYLADNAIQTERSFITFRSTAENQKLERIQLENAVAVNRTALQVEQMRTADAALELQAAQQTRAYAQLRQTNAQDTLNDWNTKGWELGSVNAALSWASVAGNDQSITYTGVRYDGQRHDYDGDVSDFYDVLTDVRERLNFELQRNRLQRQVAEAAAEVTIAGTREQQAAVRAQIQQLSVNMAAKRLEGAQEMLDFAQDRTFNEALWFQLANELQDLTRSYLDMAIYAAFLMQRAYELEFDRRLNRIRLDYGIGQPGGLLGGDDLKRDIASFAVDYLQHAQKKNPVRLTISLRDEFPAAFNAFLQQGILPFRTDLEIFDRRFPGTYQRKLKKIEIFVEGLVPQEGATGVLTHGGVSTEWRRVGGNWVKHNRALPSERMLLSSYEYRRDYTVFQPSQEMLDLFENLGPQGNWRLELPMSSNNLDYQAISDIKFVVYFDAAFDDSLRTFLKTFYPAGSGRSLVLSSRFHFPDQYFRLDADRRVAFKLPPQQFAYNYTNMKLSGLTVRLLAKDGGPVAGAALTVTRGSDNSAVNATTDAAGRVLGDPATMAPFNAWKGASPADTFTVALGAAVDASKIGDVQLALDYGFTYRADGVLAA
jgi:hypothetical protein